MKKKIFLLPFALGFIVNLSLLNNSINFVSNKASRSNLLENYANPNVNPTFPGKDFNLNLDSGEVYNKVPGGGGTVNGEKENNTIIDFTNLAENRSQLTSNYKDFNINFSTYFYGSNANDTVRNLDKTFQFSQVNNSWMQVGHENGWNNKRNEAWFEVKFEWISDLKMRVNVRTKITSRGNMWTYHWTRASMNIKTHKIASKNNWSSQNSSFTSTMQKDLKIDSQTSKWLDSTLKLNIWGEEQPKSNKELIIEEIKKRTKTLSNYDLWNTHIDLDNTVISIPHETNGLVNVKFNKKQNSTAANSFTKEYVINTSIKFDSVGIVKKINDTFNKKFILTTNTSLDSSNNTVIDKQDSLGNLNPNPNKGMTNLQVINREVQKRFDSLFTKSPQLKDLIIMNPPTFNQSKDKIQIKFSDKGDSGLIANGQWVQVVEMPIEINPTDIALQRSFLERISLSPGLMINPDDPLGELILDEPEMIYENGNRIFIYHNYLDFSFQTFEGWNETVTINQEPVEVYNNIYRKRLNDSRINDKNQQKEVKYDIEINGMNYVNGKPEPIKTNFTIMIRSKISRSTFKWLGWSPDSDPTNKEGYAQWIVTQEKITNAEGSLVDNPNYDPTIDPETGIRIQKIWVNSNKEYINRNPFPIDPIDKWGNIIKDDEKNNYEYGYFAEAYVANSGVVNILDKSFTDTISKVERVKIDPKTGNELESRKIVDLEKETQFSTKGLYEYFFYLKDKAPIYEKPVIDDNGKPIIDPETGKPQKVKLNPSDVETYPPNGESIIAESGNVLHKFVYISKDESDSPYQQFLNIPDIQANSKFSEFTNTFSLASTHLKWYLINEYGFDQTKLESLSFEGMFSYWKQYVSEMKAQIISPPTEPVTVLNLNDLDLDFIKMNSTNPIELFSEIKNYAIKEVNNYLDKNKSDALYRRDWSIYLNGIELTDANAEIYLKDFANISTKRKTESITIKALDNSTKLVGQKRFKAINDPEFNPDKVLNLNFINWRTQTYDFSNVESKEEFISKWIMTLIQEQLNSAIELVNPKQPILNTDYDITISKEVNGELKIYDQNTEEFQEEVSKFLNLNNPDKKIKQKLNLKIRSTEESNILIGNTEQRYINDQEAEISPPKPPIDKSKNISSFLNVKELEILELYNKNNNPEKWDEETVWFKNNEKLWDRLVYLQKEQNNQNWAGNDPEFAIKLNKYLDSLQISDFELFYKDLGYKPIPNPENTEQVLYTNNFSVKTANKDLYHGSTISKFYTTDKIDEIPEKFRPDINDLFKITNIGQITDVSFNGKVTEQAVYERLMEINNLDKIEYPKDFFTFKWNWTNQPEGNRFYHSVKIGLTMKGSKQLRGEKVDITYWTLNKDGETKPDPKPDPDPDPKPDPDPDPKPKPSFNKVNLAWIVPLSIIGFTLLVFLIRWISNRRKSKYIGKK